MDEIKLCAKCGFILGTRPNSRVIHNNNEGVCGACVNHEKKDSIDFASRQKWLTQYIAENKTHEKYDCLVAVSGGKDSTAIVRKLFENHGVKKALLVNVTDHFTHTKAGVHNLNNIIKKFNCDLLKIYINPEELAERMRRDLEDKLNPIQWLEEQLVLLPFEVGNHYGIKLIFIGENSDFEYGGAESLEIFHPFSTENARYIYMGAIYRYSAAKWYEEAKEVGLLDLNHFNEWQRQGQIENYSQIDSIGYQMGIWTKFVKFGFQRVSDIACRLVRDGFLTREQASLHIKEKDHICDPASKRDFCRAVDITEDFFDKMVDKHANKKLVVKDINGVWRRKDLI